MFKKINKKPLIFLISLTLGLLLFVYTVVSSDVGHIIQTLKSFSLLKFLIFLALSFANSYLLSLRWEFIVKAMWRGKKISTFTFFWDRLAAFAFGYVAPIPQVGGEPLRIMLIEEEGVPPHVALSSTIIDKALEISSLVVFISLGILMAIFNDGIDNSLKLLLGAIGLAMLFLVFWFYFTSIRGIGFFSTLYKILHLKKISRLEHLEKKLHGFEVEMNAFYKGNAKVLWQLIAISLLTITFILAEHFMVAWFMGVRLTFMQAFLASTIPYIAYLMPVPGGIGVLEGVHATIFLVTGVTINAVAFVFIIRLRDLVLVGLGLVRGWHKGYKMIKKEFKEDFEVVE
jgi:uncharacterized protein (TIRG00374 family)